MRRCTMRNSFTVLGLATLLACSSTIEIQTPALQDGETLPAVPDGATPQIFTTIAEASTSVSVIDQPERLVISTSQEWEAYWLRFSGSVSPTPPTPNVDFSAERVATAAMGSRSTGGFNISVREVSGDNEGIYVVVVETSPGPSCLVTQAFTAPAVAVRVPGDGRPVVFVEETVVQDCG